MMMTAMRCCWRVMETPRMVRSCDPEVSAPAKKQNRTVMRSNGDVTLRAWIVEVSVSG